LGNPGLGETSDIVTIAQDNQLDDEIVVGREIKGQNKRIRQTTLIEISIDVGGNDEIVVVLHDLRDRDRQLFADDVPFCSTPDGRFAPVVSELIVDKRIVSKDVDQPIQVEAVRCLDECGNQRRERDWRAGRRRGAWHCSTTAAIKDNNMPQSASRGS
jgi:hypothetical protein